MLSKGSYFSVLAAYSVVVCSTANLAMAARNISDDQSALLALRSYIVSEPDQILARNWSFAASVCDWVGVTCSSLHHRVTALNISPELANLSFLVSLDMGRNYFYGKIPKELAGLRRLRYINLSFNKLSGEVPSWICFLTELQYLSLGNNSFSGFIPLSISNCQNRSM